MPPALPGGLVVAAIRQIREVVDLIDAVRGVPQLGTWRIGRDRAESHAQHARQQLLRHAVKVARGLRPPLRVPEHVFRQSEFRRVFRANFRKIRHLCRLSSHMLRLLAILVFFAIFDWRFLIAWADHLLFVDVPDVPALFPTDERRFVGWFRRESMRLRRFGQKEGKISAGIDANSPFRIGLGRNGCDFRPIPTQEQRASRMHRNTAGKRFLKIGVSRCAMPYTRKQYSNESNKAGLQLTTRQDLKRAEIRRFRSFLLLPLPNLMSMRI